MRMCMSLSVSVRMCAMYVSMYERHTNEHACSFQATQLDLLKQH